MSQSSFSRYLSDCPSDVTFCRQVNPVTSAGYTPLHQAAQQGHTLIISLLLEHKAQPNAVTNVSTEGAAARLVLSRVAKDGTTEQAVSGWSRLG